MACVNVPGPGHALAPISRLMARVWGNSDNPYDAKVALKPKQHVEKISEKSAEGEEKGKSERRKEVHIDSTTMVPTELYWSMLRAGERAKNRGQHRLKDRSSRKLQESPRPHLVKSN
ncbi:unnamed protein product [Effrenium voratum]|uniref:Uncharacterized protein n=1 Tax=Effrenium voratum TaxID=2562239 RepID=A0AA36MWR1_9DINO|nr:unnamed protein product [Effrenium voratum]CAJ1383279.1 unnamed protein product [Effrenium voratum]|mmetsp:Transcript_126549/g.300552  ORF Transcript_126549/g.300552 Transcript_126549/m.300552 type:complete len:117 (-) Transcript_126549:66-416(-)